MKTDLHDEMEPNLEIGVFGDVEGVGKSMLLGYVGAYLFPNMTEKRRDRE